MDMFTDLRKVHSRGIAHVLSPDNCSQGYFTKAQVKSYQYALFIRGANLPEISKLHKSMVSLQCQCRFAAFQSHSKAAQTLEKYSDYALHLFQ